MKKKLAIVVLALGLILSVIKGVSYMSEEVAETRYQEEPIKLLSTKVFTLKVTNVSRYKGNRVIFTLKHESGVQYELNSGYSCYKPITKGTVVKLTRSMYKLRNNSTEGIWHNLSDKLCR